MNLVLGGFMYDHPVLFLIIVVVIGIALLAALLAIARRFLWLQFGLMAACSIGLVVYSFVNGNNNDDALLNSFIEALLLFGFSIFCYADIAFDREEYWELKFDKVPFSDDYWATASLKDKSEFWGTLGAAAGGSALLVGLTHFFAQENQGVANRIVGFYGIACIVFMLIMLGILIKGYLEARSRYE